MAKLNHFACVTLICAVFSLFRDSSSHTVDNKSVLSWFRNDEKPKLEIPGYRPILEVHKYKGVQINPVSGDSPIPFEYRTPPVVGGFSVGSDLQIVNQFYRAVPYLPEVERMHEFNLGFFGPYVQTIPDASIDRLRATFESEGEEKVGSSGKAKLLKLLQIIQEMKLKSLKTLYNKKKDVVQFVLNYLHPPSTPQPAPVYPRPPPPPPPSPSESVLVSAAPNTFAWPTPSFIPVEFPYHSTYLAPQLSTLHNTYNFPGIDASNSDGSYFQALAANSISVPFTSSFMPLTAAGFPSQYEHLGTPYAAENGWSHSQLPSSDLLTSGSENVEIEKLSAPVSVPTPTVAPSKPVEENKVVMKIPKSTTSTSTSTVPSSTAMITHTSIAESNTESSSYSSSSTTSSL